MALDIQKVVSDLGSDEVKLLRLQVNALLDVIDALANGASGEDLRNAVRAADIKKIVSTRELPAAKRFPIV